MVAESENPALKIFFSYSHRDERLRDELETHLTILSRNGVVSTWHDRRIVPGSDWANEIDTQLEESDIVLLLVSADFIASDYCYGKEMKRALERHEANLSVLVPVIVRPVDWSSAPFSRIQALPKDGQAVTSWHNQDEAWLDVARGMRDAIEEVRKRRNRVSDGSRLMSMKDLLITEVDKLDQAYERYVEGSTTFRGFSTGLRDLDGITDGLHSSSLFVIASRPEMGKTDLALGIALHAAIEEGRTTAFFSLNLPAERITRKLVSSLGRVDSHRLLRGALDDEDWPRVTSAVGILAETPLYVDEGAALDILTLKMKIGRLREERGLDLVVIDSLQHLTFQTETNIGVESRHGVGKALKTLAKELKIPIVVTSSLSPDIELRINKRPVFSDLDGFRDIEEDADLVLFLYRDDVYDFDSADRGTAELIVAKNALGPVGTVTALYLNQYGRFEDIRHSRATDDEEVCP